MKAVKITLAGRERYLAFTGSAMFDIREKFGGTAELLEAVKEDSRKGLQTAAAAAALLAQQGELVRRHLGYDPEPFVEAEAIEATIAPGEITALKLAIPAAITLGFGREIAPEDGEVDLGLAELNAQKKTTSRGPTM